MHPSSSTENSYLCKTGQADKERLDAQSQLAIIPLREALTKWTERLDKDSILQLLDFGCGAGSSMDKLQKQFPKATYIGLDRSKEQIDVAQKAHPKGIFLVGDEKNKIGCKELSKADLVFMQFVAMHQNDLKAFFTNVVEKMKPGAQLLIFDPYSDSKRIKLDNEAKVVEAQNARFKLKAEMAESVGRLYNAAKQYPKLLKGLGMVRIDKYSKENMCFALEDIRTILVSNWETARENERFRPFISITEVDRHIKALKEAKDDTIVYLGDTRIIIAQKPCKE